MREDLWKGLTEKQVQRAKACKNQEELLKMAKEEGIELTDEQLEAVAGGCGTHTNKDFVCPSCGNHGMRRSYSGMDSTCTCVACGYKTDDIVKCDPFGKVLH